MMLINLREINKLMSEGIRQSLRPKRVNKYLLKQDQEADKNSSTRQSSAKEKLTPAQEANLVAKLFLKFISSINHHLDLHIAKTTSTPKEITDPLHPDKPFTNQTPQNNNTDKPSQIQSQSNKKKKDTGKKLQIDIRKELQKKNNQIERQKKRIAAQEQKKRLKRQKLIDEAPPKYSLHFQTMLDNFEKLRSIEENKKLRYFTLLIKEKEMFFGSSSANTQMQDPLPPPPLPDPELSVAISKPSIPVPIFKRASYHIAGAYLVHLNRFDQKSYDYMMRHIDPTRMAKKLKGEVEGNPYEEDEYMRKLGTSQ